MQFMTDCVSHDVERWTLSSGSMTQDRMILNPHSYAQVSIKASELAYIPKAFWVSVYYDHEQDWRDSDVVAEFKIKYKEGDKSHAVVPLNRTSYYLGQVASDNACYVFSGPFDSCKFFIKNNSNEIITITQFAVYPSIDLDEGQEQSIETLLPQMAYAYNETLVTANAGVEAQIVQLPVSISKSTNLVVHATITGECDADTIICSLKMDGELIKSFPIRQTFQAGKFNFGIPSLIPFVQGGPHLITIHITTTSGQATVAREEALLMVEGRSILGGASGEYPHAEVFTEILSETMPNLHPAGDSIELTQVPPTIVGPLSDRIPSFSYNLSSSVSFSIITYGFVYDFLDETIPIALESIPPHVYRNNTGVGAERVTTFESTRNSYNTHCVDVLEVNKTGFDPVYSIHVEEV